MASGNEALLPRRTRVFTTGVLLRRGRLLLLRRKEDDDTYPGMWDALGGHFEKGESAEECMTREAMEESGLKVRFLKSGRLIEYTDRYGRAISIPFLLQSRSGEVVLSEHSTYLWIRPEEVSSYDIVPDLREALSVFGLASKESRRFAPTRRNRREQRAPPPRRAGRKAATG